MEFIDLQIQTLLVTKTKTTKPRGALADSSGESNQNPKRTKMAFLTVGAWFLGGPKDTSYKLGEMGPL